MMAADALSECGLEMVSDDSKVWTSLFGSACTTVSEFENIINNKINKKKKRSNTTGKSRKDEINKEGAIILRDCIIDKLNLLIKKASGQSDKLSLMKRIEFYNSPDFINRFTEQMPTKTGNMRTKYASYFDMLFNVVSKDTEGWRNRFNPYSDQEQCMRAKSVNKKKFNTVVAIQDTPGTNTVCYLCSREILPRATGQKTMECEHILPVSCALSHWWLIKSHKDQTLRPDQLDVLSKEYGWSHRCCNQIKTNSEFIVYDGGKQQYVFNIKLVRTMLHDIKTSTKYDCQIANSRPPPLDINKQLINIRRTVQPLLNKINQNLNNTSSNDMYDLICKLKIISAMSMDSFDSVISNTTLDYDGTAKTKATKKGKVTKQRNKDEAVRDAKAEKSQAAATKAEQTSTRAERKKERDKRKEGVAGSVKPSAAKKRNLTRKQNTGEQRGGSAAEQQTETEYVIEDEVAKLLNLINSGLDEEIKSDIEEKYEDLINNYKYTVFHTNRYGKIVKHKYWIYYGAGEDPESVMNTIRQNATDRTAAEISPEDTSADRTAAEVSSGDTDNQERWVWVNGWYQDYWDYENKGWASEVDYDNWVRGSGINKKKKQGRKKRNTRRKKQKRKKKRTTMRKKQRLKK